MLYGSIIPSAIWLSNRLVSNKAADKIQSKAIKSENIEDLRTSRKIRDFSKEYLNMDEVSKQNVQDRIAAESRANNPKFRQDYKDYIPTKDEKEFSMLSDWRYWALGFAITLGLYWGINHYYDGNVPDPSTMYQSLKTNSYNLYTKVKTWLFGNGGGPNPPANPPIQADVPTNIVNNADIEIIDATPKGKAPELPSQEFVQGSSTDVVNSSIQSSDSSNPAASLISSTITTLLSNYNRVSDVYPVQWAIPTDLDSRAIYYDLKYNIIGKLVYFLIEVEKIALICPNFIDLISSEDQLFLAAVIHRLYGDVIAFNAIYSTTAFYNLNDLIDAYITVALLDHIPPVVDYMIKTKLELMMYGIIHSSILPFSIKKS